nr:unnamed protein product [Digitaria exilis]
MGGPLNDTSSRVHRHGEASASNNVRLPPSSTVHDHHDPSSFSSVIVVREPSFSSATSPSHPRSICHPSPTNLLSFQSAQENRTACLEESQPSYPPVNRPRWPLGMAQFGLTALPTQHRRFSFFRRFVFPLAWPQAAGLPLAFADCITCNYIADCVAYNKIASEL